MNFDKFKMSCLQRVVQNQKLYKGVYIIFQMDEQYAMPEKRNKAKNKKKDNPYKRGGKNRTCQTKIPKAQA